MDHTYWNRRTNASHSINEIDYPHEQEESWPPAENHATPSRRSWNASLNGLPVMPYNRTTSGEGVGFNPVRQQQMLEQEGVRGENDCGLQSLAGITGNSVETVLTNTFPSATAEQVYHGINQNQMTLEQYELLSGAQNTPVSRVSSMTDLARIPQPGKMASMIEHSQDGSAHMVNLARSESGNHVYRIDHQAKRADPYRLQRTPQRIQYQQLLDLTLVEHRDNRMDVDEN